MNTGESLFTQGWVDNAGPELFTVGWIDSEAVVPPVITPEPVYPPGMGPEERLRHKRILQEDEMIMAVILAFLDIKDN